MKVSSSASRSATAALAAAAFASVAFVGIHAASASAVAPASTLYVSTYPGDGASQFSYVYTIAANSTSSASAWYPTDQIGTTDFRQNSPNGGAFDASGNFYCPTYTYAITQVTPTGAESFTATNVNTNTPTYDIASYGGNIYALGLNGGIYEYSTTSTGQTAPLSSYTILADTATGSPNELENGLAIVSDGAGNLYVSSSANGAIYKVTLNSGSLTGANSSTLTSGLSGLTWGLAIDGKGNLYASSSVAANAVYQIPTTGGSAGIASVFATMATGTTTNGVAIDANGNMYVSGQVNGTGTDWGIDQVGQLVGGTETALSSPAELFDNDSTGVPGAGTGNAQTTLEPTYLAFYDPAVAVPEPASLSLLAIGALGLLRRRRARPSA